ncbi:domain containing protein [Seminavis robusta]|uniref:Domain containing protein n=1 Tax=Seminavis robusta TaxID=568900 RepID=A0A9N8D6I1_9STRA|nr:domain containing protein [Seminavis robusta]|eukprot:Sro13_g009770.1 domain containing protein (350) ;mRNA; f:26824-28049
MTIKKTANGDEENQWEQEEDEVYLPREEDPVEKPAKVLDDDNNNANVPDVEEEGRLPAACYCSITKQIMGDPVVGPNGDSFEKEAVMERQGGELLSYYPNRALRAYMDEQQEVLGEEGSVRGTLRKLDNNLRTNWDRMLENTSLATALGGESRPLPDEFYCTLTLDLPHEPVIDPEGFTYEKDAIVHWVRHNGDSPVTRKPLSVDQLYDNNAVLCILLEESEKPEDNLHPCIRRWKEELMNPPPSIVPPDTTVNALTTTSSSGMGGIPMNGEQSTEETTTTRTYPTTHEEMEERLRREHRASMISLLLIIVIISFALIYLPFYLVVFVLAFCSCMYARRRFHERHHQRA